MEAMHIRQREVQALVAHAEVHRLLVYIVEFAGPTPCEAPLYRGWPRVYRPHCLPSNVCSLWQPSLDHSITGFNEFLPLWLTPVQIATSKRLVFLHRCRSTAIRGVS